MKRKKWTEDDSIHWRDKIHLEYNHLIVRHGKSPTLKSAFEDRYYTALRSRVDMATFFKAEWEVVRAYNEMEDYRKDQRAQKRHSAKKTKPQSDKSYADRVLEQLKERIVKYPRLPIHEEASEDMERLYGAISLFDKRYWSDLDQVFREYYPIRHSRPTSQVETMLVNLAAPSSGRLPRVLGRYVNMLSSEEMGLSIITKEHKRCILEGAFFFHEVRKFIINFQNDQKLSEIDSQKVKKVLTFVEQVLEDFRLRDLKPV